MFCSLNRSSVMGLSMYVFQTTEDNLSEDPTDVVDESKLVEVYYWRNHPKLHRWFENLYREKGGKYKEFNCEYVKVTIEDINKLEQVLKEDELPIYNDGYMKFGCFSLSYELSSVKYNHDIQFITIARNILEDSNSLVYSACYADYVDMLSTNQF